MSASARQQADTRMPPLPVRPTSPIRPHRFATDNLQLPTRPGRDQSATRPATHNQRMTTARQQAQNQQQHRNRQQNQQASRPDTAPALPADATLDELEQRIHAELARTRTALRKLKAEEQRIRAQRRQQASHQQASRQQMSIRPGADQNADRTTPPRDTGARQWSSVHHLLPVTELQRLAARRAIVAKKPPIPEKRPVIFSTGPEDRSVLDKHDRQASKTSRHRQMPPAAQTLPLPVPANRHRFASQQNKTNTKTPPPPTHKPQTAIVPALTDGPQEWSTDVIATARRTCDRLLAGIDTDVKFLPALRKGQCGTPAPVRLLRIGGQVQGSTGITITPAPTLTCAMVNALAHWLEDTVQPLAIARFGVKVKKLHNVSSYVCRRRYNAKRGRISQHAYANALDIAAFTLNDGRKISVLSYWGPTRRDLNRQAGTRPANHTGRQLASANTQQHKPFRIGKGTDALSAALTVQATLDDGKKGSLQLGVEARFLRGIHKAACKYFGTVLGPEANRAHRDHFHLDMTPRRHRHYCE